MRSLLILGILSIILITRGHSQAPRRPNVILIFADDLGYGDVQFYGHPTSNTPNLDRIGRQAKILTNFHVTSPVCSPSRSSLLTGLYQVTTGIYPGVFWPDDIGGLPQRFPTIAKVLKQNGYATAHVGKWHLGVGADGVHLPIYHGFDQYFGIPYSQDMCPCKVCFPNDGPCLSRCNDEYVSCPLYDNDTVVEQPVKLTSLTERYTARAVNFIEKNSDKDKPFFLYMAYQHTHKPQFAGEKFHNSTSRGPFGDSLAEMDHSIGQLFSATERANIANNTLVIFASDNGPSLSQHERGGCAGLLRCGKGTTWEGGTRVPAFVYWAGVVSSGYSSSLITSLDVLPTIAALVNHSKPIFSHGFDASSALFGQDSGEDNPWSVRDSFLYFPESPNPKIGPFALHYKNFKAHFFTQGSWLSDSVNYDHMCRNTHPLTPHKPPLLYNLDTDPGERYPVSGHAALLREMADLKKELESLVPWGKSQMKRGKSHRVAPCCNRKSLCQPYPRCCDCRADSHNEDHEQEEQGEIEISYSK